MIQNNSLSCVKSLADIPYEIVYGFFPHKKAKEHTVAIAYGKNEEMPWAVGYCGRSSYFHTLHEAVAYCVERGFIKRNEFEKLTASINGLLTITIS